MDASLSCNPQVSVRRNRGLEVRRGWSDARTDLGLHEGSRILLHLDVPKRLLYLRKLRNSWPAPPAAVCMSHPLRTSHAMYSSTFDSYSHAQHGYSGQQAQWPWYSHSDKWHLHDSLDEGRQPHLLQEQPSASGRVLADGSVALAVADISGRLHVPAHFSRRLLNLRKGDSVPTSVTFLMKGRRYKASHPAPRVSVDMRQSATADWPSSSRCRIFLSPQNLNTVHIVVHMHPVRASVLQQVGMNRSGPWMRRCLVSTGEGVPPTTCHAKAAGVRCGRRCACRLATRSSSRPRPSGQCCALPKCHQTLCHQSQQVQQLCQPLSLLRWPDLCQRPQQMPTGQGTLQCLARC